MENQVPATVPPRRWPLFLAGLGIFILAVVLGPTIYFVQMAQDRNLSTPWHMPILATVGVLLMAASVVQRRGIWRSAGLGVFALLCGFLWFFVAVLTKTPPYEGPAVYGAKVPVFSAAHADGRAFTDKDLLGTDRTVMLFFRGRW